MSHLASHLFVVGLRDYMATMHWLAPVLHLAWVAALGLIFWKGDQARRLFAGIVAGGYLFLTAMPFVFIVLNGHGRTGVAAYLESSAAGRLLLGRCSLGAGLCLLIALLWGLEALRPRNHYDFASVALWRWWVLPFFSFAVTYPLTPGFPVHQQLGFESLLLSPFGLLPGATSLAIVSLLTLCRSVNRPLAIGMPLAVLGLTVFVEPRWWVGIPQIVVAAHCLVFWGGPWVAGRNSASLQAAASPEDS